MKSKFVKIAEDKKSFNRKQKISDAETEREKFLAETVVLATGAWTSLIKGAEFALPEIKPIRGQIIEFHTAKRLFGKVIYSPRGYLVPRADGRILVGRDGRRCRIR